MRSLRAAILLLLAVLASVISCGGAAAIQKEHVSIVKNWEEENKLREQEEEKRGEEHDRFYNEWMRKLHEVADWASAKYDRFEEEHPLEWEAYRSRMEGGARESREAARRELEKKLGIIDDDDDDE